MIGPIAAASGHVATRAIFWHFPGWLEVTWYVLAIGSVGVFAYGILRPVSKYLRGAREPLPPRRELPDRLRRALRITLTHVNVRRRDALAGAAHATIFYGFLTLFAGTVILGIDTDVTEPLFGWRFFKGDFYDVYSFILDVMGVVLLVGLLAMMVRRGLIRPRKLDYDRPDRAPDEPQFDRRRYRWGDWVFIGGLFYLVVSGYLLEGIRIAMIAPATDPSSPLGTLASHLFTGVGKGELGVIRMSAWWLHGLVALTWVAAIPYTKAAHMLTSFASLVLQDPKAGKHLRPIPPEKTSLPAGYGSLKDFSTPHLLQLDACTKCGKCHVACPANATGRPLSPRDVVLELREQAKSSFAEVGIGGVLGPLLEASRNGEGAVMAPPSFDHPVVGADKIKSETVWACMQCNACVEACPVGIEQAPIINMLRRRLVEDGELPTDLQSTFQVIQKTGNSFGENKRKRGRWTTGLDFDVVDARKQAVDVLWFVGDYASYDPRSQEISRTLARLYRAAGVDFGILYDGERNAGNDVRRAGEEGLWEMLADENVKTLAECDFQRIVTSDPHSLNTLRNEYRDVGGGDWMVMHHTALLLELIESGRLLVRNQLGRRVTYHDPCYLGRHNGEYDGPRRILELIGCELIEMPRNRDNSFCCGAGGGRIWIRDSPGQERPSENRIREALTLGEVDHFVVTCPKDVTMYEDAIKTTDSSDRLKLKELTELVFEAVGDVDAIGAGADGTQGVTSPSS